MDPCFLASPHFLFSRGANILPSLVALGLELSSSPQGLGDKVESPRVPSGCASLHLAYWAVRPREQNPSAPPSPPVPFLPILLSSGCCNKAPQTRWFTTTEMYPLTVLEARSQKSRCQQGHLSLWGNPSLPLPSFWWWLPIFGVPSLAAVSRQSLPLSSHGILPV